MNSPNWERLRIFKAVLESGSLAEAARRLGLSQPTVGRQVRALEAELNEALVDITPDGVLPTASALRIEPAIDEMMRSAETIRSMQDVHRDTPVVRITCGPWLSILLSRYIHELLGRPIDTEIEIVSSVAFADLPRREADIAIRNQQPDNKRLVRCKLPDFAYAVYGASALINHRREALDDRRFSEMDWVSLIQELEHLPTARWLRKRLRRAPVARFSASTNLLQALRSDRVLAVLPCFVGDPEEDLVKVSRAFVPDCGGQWMVMAHDVRRRPHVRRIADRIIQFLEFNRALLLPSSVPGKK